MDENPIIIYYTCNGDFKNYINFKIIKKKKKDMSHPYNIIIKIIAEIPLYLCCKSLESINMHLFKYYRPFLGSWVKMSIGHHELGFFFLFKLLIIWTVLKRRE